MVGCHRTRPSDRRLQLTHHPALTLSPANPAWLGNIHKGPFNIATTFPHPAIRSRESQCKLLPYHAMFAGFCSKTCAPPFDVGVPIKVLKRV